MDHAYIEEHHVADRYVMGTLAPAEAERFEEHYLSCPECLDRLDLAESIQRGFHRMAGEDAARLSAARQLAVVAWLARLGSRRQAAVLLTALLVLAVLPAGLALRGLAGRDRELAEARSALQAERQSERQRTATGARSATEAAALRQALDASRRDLEGERAARARAAEQLAQAVAPEGNVPILNLDVERGGPAAGEPTQRVRRPPSAGRIVLVLSVDPPLLPSYRAVLRDRRGRELWQDADLRPSERETLTLSLPASLLSPGDYAIALEGLAPGGKPAPAGRFAFRVLPPA
jgi:hypothetical protein